MGRASAPVLGAFLILIAGTAGASVTTATLRSDASAVVWDVRFDEPVEEVARDAGDAWRRVTVPGAGVHGDVGWPRVPVYRAVVAIPPDVDIRSIDAQPLTVQALPGDPIAPVPRVLPHAEGGARTSGVAYEPAWPAGASGAWFPAVRAEVTNVSWWRNRRVAFVDVYPLRTRPGTRAVEWSGALRVTLTFAPAAGAADRVLAPPHGRDGWDALLDSRIVNATASRGWLRSVRPLPFRRGGGPYFTDAPNWFRVETVGEGIVSLTGAALQSAGALLPIDTSTLRLFLGETFELPADVPVEDPDAPPFMREVAAVVEDGGDGQLSAGDRVEFFALPVDGYRDELDASQPDSTHVHYQYANERVYWVSFGGTSPRAPHRSRVLAAPPREGGTPVDRVTHRVHAESNRFFNPGPKHPLVRWEKWWWNAGYNQSDGSPRFVAFDLDGHVAGTTGTFLARFWGASSEIGLFADHRLTVTLNGLSYPFQEWNGRTYRDITDPALDANPNLLKSGRNTFTILVDPTDDPSLPEDDDRVDRVLLAFLEVRHQRHLRWVDEGFAFRSPSAPGTYTYTIDALPDASAEVYDVTDPTSVTRVTGSTGGGAGAATFTFTRTETSAPRTRYLVTHPSERLAPVSVERDTPPPGGYLRTLRAPADYVIVYYDAFETAANTLAEFRRAMLPGVASPRVLTVRLSDVFDEFAWGMPDPTAIRNFVRFAYDNYRDDPGVPRLRYVTLLGDADFDHRDHESSANVDYLPAWSELHEPSLWLSDYEASWPADDFFGLLDGPSDQAMDVAVGRIPAQSVTQANDMVTKVIQHASPDRGAWQAHATFIADDLCQGDELDASFYFNWTHTRQAEGLADLVPAEMDIDRIYLVDYPDPVTGLECRNVTKPSARDALVRRINDGTWLVDYVGHGGETVMADERALESSDIPQMTNARRYHYFVTASCSVGKFDDVSEGLGETIVKHRTGGAINSFSAAAVASSGDNVELNEALLSALFVGGQTDTDSIRTIGEASVIAKPSGGLNSRKYNVLGDPANRIAWAQHDVDLSFAASTARGGAPDTLFRGERTSVTGRVVDESGAPLTTFTGMASLRVFDSQEFRDRDGPFNEVDYLLPGAPIYRAEVPVVDGVFDADFVVPTGLRRGVRGNAHLRCFVTGDGSNDAYGGMDDVVVSEDVRPGSVLTDSIGPVISLSFEGPDQAVPAQSTLDVSIEDESGVYITQLLDARSVVLSFEEPDGFEVALVDLAPNIVFRGSDNATAFQSAEVEVPIPASLNVNRPYRVRVRASDNLGNRTAVERDIFLVSSGGGDVQRVFVYPNPTPSIAQFFVELTFAADVRIKIHTITGRLIRTLEASFAAGEGRTRPVRWNLRDADGDPVANGSYLYTLEIRAADGRPVERRQGWVAVLR